MRSIASPRKPVSKEVIRSSGERVIVAGRHVWILVKCQKGDSPVIREITFFVIFLFL